MRDIGYQYEKYLEAIDDQRKFLTELRGLIGRIADGFDLQTRTRASMLILNHLDRVSAEAQWQLVGEIQRRFLNPPAQVRDKIRAYDAKLVLG